MGGSVYASIGNYIHSCFFPGGWRTHFLSLDELGRSAQVVLGPSKESDIKRVERRRKSSRLATAFVFRCPRPRPLCGKATISPGQTPDKVADINDSHGSYERLYEALLFDTAEQLGVTLTGELQPCTGCSMGKGLRKGKPFIHVHACKTQT